MIIGELFMSIIWSSAETKIHGKRECYVLVK